MQKISGIIPSSPRVASVDLKEAAPVRPGTPGFGRPEGVSSLKERANAAASASAFKARFPGDEPQSKESEQAESVAQISERFFGRNMRDADAAGADGGRNEDLQNTIIAIPVLIEGSSDPASMSAAAGSLDSKYKYDKVADALKDPVPRENFDLVPKGSYLDVVA